MGCGLGGWGVGGAPKMKMAHVAALCRGFFVGCGGGAELISVKERDVNVRRQGALQWICSLGGRRRNSASERLCNQGPIH